MKLPKRIVKPIMIILITLGVGYGTYYGYQKIFANKPASAAVQETIVQVARGDLSVNISGTGTVEPISRYDIVPLVTGNILDSPFEEGMQVNAGDLLYKIDDSDLSINIAKTQNSIAKAELNNQSNAENIKDLNVTAPFDGKIINFSISEGDILGNNAKIAEIIDDSTLVAKLPFNGSQIKHIKVGQDAQLLLPDYMRYIDGKVISKNDTGVPSGAGGIAYYVEIAIDNPGALVIGTEVSGTVKTPQGNMASVDDTKLEYGKQQTIIAQTGGTVKKIYAKNNEAIKSGEKLIELENTALTINEDKNALDLKDLYLSLDSQMEKLKNYSIVSPITGTVIKKNFKIGDTINNTSASTILMTVADMSKMKFTLAIDELDIAKIQIGQKATVQADALPGKQFEAQVTNISAEGKAQNGVTTYDVEITIPQPGELRSGMNVNAEIFVEKKENVLYLPLAAVQKTNGKTFVFVKDEAAGETANKATIEQKSESKQRPNAQGSVRPGRNTNMTGTPGTAGTINKKMKLIEVGINTDEYIEIISGLQEGEQVILPATSSPSSNRMPNGFGGMGGMGGAVRISR